MAKIATKSLCSRCAALCCNYITIEIDKPRNKRNYDDIRWYILHEGISLMVEDERWLIKVPTSCKELDSKNRCSIYETRPITCQDYEADNCDYYNEYEDWDTDYIEIETPRQLEKYRKKMKKKKKKDKS